MTPIQWSKLRFVLKALELIVSCVCIGIFVKVQSLQHRTLLLPIVFGAYVIITAGSLLGFITGEKISKKVDLLYTFSGAVLFIGAGGLGIDVYASELNDQLEGLVSASLSLANGVVMLIDGCASYRDINEYCLQ